jgi:hypothetical protein
MVAGLTTIGGGFTYMSFTQARSVVILVLVFLSMALNFRLPADGDGPSAQ